MSRGWFYPTVIYYFHDCEVGLVYLDFHGVVRLVTSNGYIYIISTAVRSGLPESLVFSVCHGVVRSVYLTIYELPHVVRLVTSNGYILFPRP